LPGLVEIRADRVDEAVGVLSRAFLASPLVRFLAGEDLTGDDPRMREWWRFSCAVRTELDWPLLGVEVDGRLVAAMGLSLTGTPEWPASLDAAYGRLLDALGPAGSARLEQYGPAAESHRITEPHYYLGFIGVEPSKQGRGYSRPLMDEAHRLSDADPLSTGIGLDTDTGSNVALYEHFGYRVTEILDVLDQPVWCMFRPIG
jgi:ribosomal protein S18 acetylase RimI-like enzyme